jgi:capsular exopolysaccharide synthesis family protein
MNLHEHAQRLRARWRWIVGGLLLGLALGGAMGAAAPTLYSSTTALYLSPGQSNNDPIAAYQGAMFTDQRMKSYAQLVSGDRVAQDVIAELGLDASVGGISQKLLATAQPNTAVLQVTATDTAPAEAADLANAAAASLTRLVPQLERPPGEEGPVPVRIQVIEPAVPQSTPVAPALGRYLLLGALGGLLAGLGLVALRDALEGRVRSTRDLQAAADAPVLGVIPLRRRGSRARAADDAAEAEAHRRLRTNLRHAALERGVLVVTSTRHGEGCSTVVFGLAAALTASGCRVLVVQADLRGPGIAGDPGTTPPAGLTDVLAGRIPVRKGIHPRPEQSFDVLGGGSAPSNPSELIGSQQLADLLQEFREEYDVLLVDAPPLLAVTDGVELAALADATILVCRHDRTRRAHLLASVASLSAVSARLVGTVLTMVPPRELPGARAEEHAAAPREEQAAPPVLAGTLRPYRLPHPRHGQDALGSRNVQASAVRHTTPAPPDNPNHHAGHQ